MLVLMPVHMASIQADAATKYTAGYYTYTVSKGKATITDVYSSIEGNVIIPSTLGGYPVTKIGYEAFDGCYYINALTIPKSVKTIANKAFFNCMNLKTVNLGEGVTSVGDKAFCYCVSLNNIIIGDNVKKIGYSAFPHSYVYIRGYCAYCKGYEGWHSHNCYYNVWYEGVKQSQIEIGSTNYFITAQWHYNSCLKNKTRNHTYSNSSDQFCNNCGNCRDIIIKNFENGKWQYFHDGVESKKTKLVKYNGKWFYIVKGEWKLQTKLVKYNGKWFYINKGKWDSKKNLLFKKSGKYLAIKGGKWANSLTGFIRINNKTFYINKGKWANKTTTLVKQGSKYYYVKNGKWSKTTAIVKYKGTSYFVKYGIAQLNYSGNYRVDGITYTIKKGKVI